MILSCFTKLDTDFPIRFIFPENGNKALTYDFEFYKSDDIHLIGILAFPFKDNRSEPK